MQILKTNSFSKKKNGQRMIEPNQLDKSQGLPPTPVLTENDFCPAKVVTMICLHSADLEFYKELEREKKTHQNQS